MGILEPEPLPLPLSPARLRLAPGDLTRIDGVFRIVSVRPDGLAWGRRLAAGLEEALNTCRRLAIYEVIDTWVDGDGFKPGQATFLLGLGALAPDLVLLMTEPPAACARTSSGELPPAAWGSGLSELFEAQRPRVVEVRLDVAGAASRSSDPHPVSSHHGMPVLCIDAGLPSAGRVLAHRLVSEGLLGPSAQTGEPQLRVFQAWLGDAGELGGREAESLARAWRLANQKLRAVTPGADEVKASLERLCQDVGGRLGLLNAVRRLQALDEYRRWLRYRNPARFEGPAAHLGGVLELLGRSERESTADPSCSGNPKPAADAGAMAATAARLTQAIDTVSVCQRRLTVLAQRLPTTAPGRGSRLAAGTLVHRIQEMLRAEVPLVAELRRQAELIDALGQRLEACLREGLGERLPGRAVSVFEDLVDRLVRLEDDCGFTAVERALNALSGRGHEALALPRLTALMRLEGPACAARVTVTATGLVPSFEPHVQSHEVTPGVRPARLEVSLPTFFLGRLEIGIDAGLELQSLVLCPTGGRPVELAAADLLPDRSGRLSTGTVFLGA